MIKGLVEGNVYRWKSTKNRILFKRYAKGAPYPFLFIDVETGEPFAIGFNALKSVEPVSSVKLIKMDKKIV